MTTKEQCAAIIAHMQTLANTENVAGMARFGINPCNTLGIPVKVLRLLAKGTGHSQELSELLWLSQIHEARILASYIGDPRQMKEQQMEFWVSQFDSWDVCDQVCSNLFVHTSLAYDKALEWSYREAEFEKRAGYVLMASLAVKDKKAGDEKFIQFFDAIKAGSFDSRNFVKKAVNWALRQIGKRNSHLNCKCLELAGQIMELDSPSARWIAADAIRELKSALVQKKVMAAGR
jgi:3-methyladenine DNA glycosylase AlkD